MTYGNVPQLSILGPLVFPVYINDNYIRQAVKSNVLLYIHDSCIIFQYKN